ncbi:MAG TPA: tetratricopeptide repeat protein [Gemmataceae bacterium]|nr:tetratricopeptide repeat protein [Gemmataceae bacterium]
MLNDPYAPCPCGSGKKFKWCCQPIHEEVAQIYAMDESGQHEAALRAMDDLIAKHPDNPEAWGRKALLLFQNEKPEEAEKALDKAFELFPNYPFGFFLKSRFRQFEGEIAGSLMLLRKAAELYDTNAKEILAQIYIEIFDCEMKLNHPVAAHAAALLSSRFNPSAEELRKGIETVFGENNPNLPACARMAYTFKPLPTSAPADRRAGWDAALGAAATGKLADAVKVFEQWTQSDANEPAGWYNLGLCQAWLGNNQAAVDALNEYVTRESDEKQAGQAWALAEVLLLGQGMEDQADLVEHTIAFGLRDPRTFVGVLAELEKDQLLAGVQVNEEEGVLSAIILQPAGPALTPEAQAKMNKKPAAYLAVIANIVRMWHILKEPLDAAFERIREKIANIIVEPQFIRGPAKFREVMDEGTSIPMNAASKEDAYLRMRDHYEKFYEETWIHRPLRSLGNVAPAEATQGVPRKKLLGLLQFLRDCCEMSNLPYDVERLERKLGIGQAAPAAATGAANIASLGAAELAGLDAGSLASADLDQAFQAATKLGAPELASKFAGILVERPAYPERTDRFPLYQVLISHAFAQSNLDSALDLVNSGEADDCKNNEGKRRNEYELRRGQVHAKRGEFDDAERVYDGLIARVPTELDYRVKAAETMLSARQGPTAAKYAKEGLALAQKQKNRDLEGHFKELLGAAQR